MAKEQSASELASVKSATDWAAVAALNASLVPVSDRSLGDLDNDTGQLFGPPNPTDLPRQFGHRQPTLRDLPADVQRREADPRRAIGRVLVQGPGSNRGSAAQQFAATAVARAPAGMIKPGEASVG
jgi:hypothetical protein